MYAPVLVTAPETPVVDLADAKMHLRVDHDDENGLITALIATATQYLDGYPGILGRCLMAQEWRQDFDCYDRCLRLPLPASTVSSIVVTSSTGATSTIDPANYELLADARGSYVRFVDGYAGPGDIGTRHGIAVTFAAGAADADDVPQPIRTAILLLVAHWYQNREAVAAAADTALPLGVEALLAPFRRIGL
jgi:uncharacterized phiE125 gp8 family phage protein